MACEIDGAIMIVLAVERDIKGGMTRDQTILKTNSGF
jgi:hypothetical protein